MEEVYATFGGSASLLDFLDERVLVVLQDGRHLVGILRSYDQFSNLVLEDTMERHVAAGKMCDIPLGLYIVRGDTIVLVAELDAEKEAALPVEPADIEEVIGLEIAEEEAAIAAGRETYKESWNMDGSV